MIDRLIIEFKEIIRRGNRIKKKGAEEVRRRDMKQSGKILICVRKKNEQKEERNRNRYLIRLFVHVCAKKQIEMSQQQKDKKKIKENK